MAKATAQAAYDTVKFANDYIAAPLVNPILDNIVTPVLDHVVVPTIEQLDSLADVGIDLSNEYIGTTDQDFAALSQFLDATPAGMGVKSASMAVGVLVGANKLKKISTVAAMSIPKVSPTVSELRKLGVKGFQAHHGLTEYLGKMLGYTSKEMADHPGILVSQFKHTGKLNPDAIHKAISKYLPPSTKFKKVNYTPQQIRDGLQKAYNDLGMSEMYNEISPLIK
ncbi:hypothetical protein [uncultured Desulfobacter sp.]|uniref:hypothetical protein n=1 Tax=uncultured Desulfobacter sp. TaxID=240139 RepID=UPI0029F5B7E5|nr:hypothetical protein [uncultured Desulfobacter sp.]